MDERCKACGAELPDTKICAACGTCHAYVYGVLTIVDNHDDVYEAVDDFLMSVDIDLGL